MKDQALLNAGEVLRLVHSRSKGFMQETDVDEYEVVSPLGDVVGTVVISTHTAVRGFRVTEHLVQRDAQGAVIRDIRR